MQTKELIKEFFPSKSKLTIDAYAADLDFFTAYLNKKNATEALELLFNLPESQAHLLVLHYKSELLQAGQKTASINRKLSTIRSLVKSALKKGFVNWTLDINNEKEELPLVCESISKSDIKSLLNTSKNQPNKIKSARDYAMIRLMYDLALKRNLLVDLQLSDLRVNNKGVTVTISGHKHLKEKTLPVATGNALKLWLKQRGTEPGPLFKNIDNARKKTSGITSTSIYRIVRVLGESVGLKVTPETIRKAAIEEAMKQAGNLGLSEQDVLVFSDHKHTLSLKKFDHRKISIHKSLSSLVAKN